MVKDEAARSNVGMLFNYRRLKDIKRCSNFPTTVTEDVAQHSFYTALLAMTIADEYNGFIQRYWIQDETQQPNEQRKFLRTEQVLRKALLHDTPEAFTSDIPWNIKHSSEEVHAVIEDAIQKHMDVVYQNASELFLSYQKFAAECKKDMEGQVVNIADMLELAIHCYEEYTKGNVWMKSLMDKSVLLLHKFVDGTEFLTACPTLVEMLQTLSEPSEPWRVAQLIDIR